MKQSPKANDLFYYLYDLRKSASLSKIHLPSIDEKGPVLLLVTKKDYKYLHMELQEMNENEGASWITSLLWAPKYALTNIPELLQGQPYILIVHKNLLIECGTENFMIKLENMRKWVTH